MPSLADFPSPEEYAQRLAERRRKASKVPEILARLSSLGAELATQQETVEALLIAVASPHELPVEDILAGLDNLETEQRASFENMIGMIVDAVELTKSNQTAIEQTLGRLPGLISQVSIQVGQLPKSYPEQVDVSSDVARVYAAVDSVRQQLVSMSQEEQPTEAPRKVIELQFEVTDRDKSGAMKNVKVKGVM